MILFCRHLGNRGFEDFGAFLIASSRGWELWVCECCLTKDYFPWEEVA